MDCSRGFTVAEAPGADEHKSMSPYGAKADLGEFAFRAISPAKEHWTGDRPTGNAFRASRPLSVLLQSKLDSDRNAAGQLTVQAVAAGELGGVNPDSAVVGFECDLASALGYQTYIERGPDEHPAHGHTYHLAEGNQYHTKPSKAVSKKLALLAAQHIVRMPPIS